MKVIESKYTLARICLVLFIAGVPVFAKAQETSDEPPAVIEQQLEDMTAANEDIETEDDGYLQQLHHFLKEPINLNYVDAGLLEQLNMLSALQIANFISYRKLLGNFISIYELQAIPSWDLSLINRIRPYISISEKPKVFQSLKNRLKNGEHSFLMRATQVLEKSKGYLLDSSEAKNYYPGSPQKVLLRYKYRSGNQLQYGFTAEKDAGEPFFRGAQQSGFDFYSAHFFVRNLGIIKSLAIGDFSVNMGQGLTEWQSLAFNKGAEITNIKRQSDILRPYNSAGEIEFNRGAGITLQKNGWETTLFASFRKLDASLNRSESNNEEFVSSLQTSGYHRTKSEIAGRKAEGLVSAGANVSYSTEKLHVGLNGIQYYFEHSIIKPAYIYNIYALTGNGLANYSIDYSYTFKNMHVFGEAAVDEHLNKAIISGLLINTDAKVAMSFLYRNISRGYQSLYSNAFTENTHTVNESGLYSGITIAPSRFVKIDAYADFYHFPWLKYRTDAPTSGNDYMLQLLYLPDKQIELQCRYRYENKPINYNPGNVTFNPVTGRPKKALRTQLKYQVNKSVILRSRFEWVWFDKNGVQPQNGFLTFMDILYKPAGKRYSGNIRLSSFQTDGYDSRIYAFENDVLYSYAIPVFFDKGYRYYLNIRYKIRQNINLWARFAQTVYSDKSEIGSGLDLIKGDKKTELKLQFVYQF